MLVVAHHMATVSVLLEARDMMSVRVLFVRTDCDCVLLGYGTLVLRHGLFSA